MVLLLCFLWCRQIENAHEPRHTRQTANAGYAAIVKDVGEKRNHG